MSNEVLTAIIGALITICTSVVGSFVWWLIKTLLKNTTQLAVLNSKIEGIIADNASMAKMKEDINALHNWRRSHNLAGDNQRSDQ